MANEDRIFVPETVLSLREGDERLHDHRSEVSGVPFNQIRATMRSFIEDSMEHGPSMLYAHLDKKFTVRLVAIIDVEGDS